MYNAPPSNLMHGIDLVEAGHKAEALRYLRRAARTEPVNAEAWLWLAAATDDREEYRLCVDQVLRLDPTHPIASQMRAQLERQEDHDSTSPGSSGIDAGPSPDDLESSWQCAIRLLRLAPDHPVAQWMRDELKRQEHTSPTLTARSSQELTPVARRRATGEDTAAHPVYESYNAPVLPPAPVPRQVARRPARRRGLWIVVGLLVIVGMVVGGALGWGLAKPLQDWLWSEESQTVEFAVGRAPGYRFRVEVPESWILADRDSDSWDARRDELTAVFPDSAGQGGVWAWVETSVGNTVIDPGDGTLRPHAISLVETDPDALARDGVVAALALTRIGPLPAALDDDSATTCDRLRALEQQIAASDDTAALPDHEVIESGIRTRGDQQDCVLVIHRRYADHTIRLPLVPDQVTVATREIVLGVLVGDRAVALWQITLADAAYDDYRSAVERIISTLSALPAE